MIEGTLPTPTGLPPANQALQPANQALQPQWVSNGSPSTQKAYALAEGFEAMLVQQLSQSMAATSGLEGEGSGASEGGENAAGTTPQPSELSTLLPQALSDGAMGAGGLGIAAQLTRELEPASANLPAGAGSGVGVGAPAGGVQVSTGTGSASGGGAVGGIDGSSGGAVGGIDGSSGGAVGGIDRSSGGVAGGIDGSGGVPA